LLPDIPSQLSAHIGILLRSPHLSHTVLNLIKSKTQFKRKRKKNIHVLFAKNYKKEKYEWSIDFASKNVYQAILLIKKLKL
jgi:hypothetical protein